MELFMEMAENGKFAILHMFSQDYWGGWRAVCAGFGKAANAGRSSSHPDIRRQPNHPQEALGDGSKALCPEVPLLSEPFFHIRNAADNSPGKNKEVHNEIYVDRRISGVSRSIAEDAGRK
jgi:hypothetical protein